MRLPIHADDEPDVAAVGRAEVADREREFERHIAGGHFGRRLDVEDADVVMGANVFLRRAPNGIGDVEQMHGGRGSAFGLGERTDFSREGLGSAAAPIALAEIADDVQHVLGVRITVEQFLGLANARQRR